MAKLNRSDFVESSAVVTKKNLERLFMVFIRRRQVLETFAKVLSSEHLEDQYPTLSAVWTILSSWWLEHNEMPSKLVLLAEFDQYLEQNTNVLYDSEIKYVRRLIRRAFEMPREELSVKWGKATARNFLHDRLARRLQGNLGTEDTRPAQLPELLRSIQFEADSIQSLTSTVTNEAFPENWQPKKINMSPTGVKFIDDFFGGGEAPQEVYCILGPTGSCKTTLALQLANRRSERCYQTARVTNGKKHGLVYVASYETPIFELQYRSALNHAKLLRDTLEEKGYEGLSGSPKPLDYERRLFRAETDGSNYLNERQRLARSLKILRPHLRLLDMTGTGDDGVNRGTGLVEELSQIIRNDLAHTPNSYVAAIYIDYAGAMVDRYLAAVNKDKDQGRPILSKFGMSCRNLLGIPFKCPVYVLHQLAGAVNGRGILSKVTHADAADCKSFAENFNFALVISNKTTSDFATLACTKYRRSPGREELLIKVEGEIGRVIDASETHELDRYTGKIAIRDKAKERRAKAAASELPQSTFSAQTLEG